MSENFIEIIKNISVCVGMIISCITLITLIFKPVRKKVVGFVTKSTNDNENIIEIKKQLINITKELTDLNDKVFQNERDRLRSEIFNCGSRCRRGVPLSEQEFRYIQNVYTKYSDKLHCNSIGTDEYNFIRDYFNSEDNQNKNSII